MVDDDIGVDNGVSPFATIQAAVDAAVNGDIIDITGGVDNIHTEAGIDIYKSLTFQGQGQSTTIIQAAPTLAASTSRIFTVVNLFGKVVNVTFQDFTVRHGKSLPSVSKTESAGAIFIVLRNGSEVTFDRVTITENESDYKGGGIYVTTAGTGSNRKVSFNQCVLSNNHAAYAGGGLYANSQPTREIEILMNRCTVSGNSAEFSGGGLDLFSGNNTLINCTIYHNMVGRFSQVSYIWGRGSHLWEWEGPNDGQLYCRRKSDGPFGIPTWGRSLYQYRAYRKY